MFYASESFTLFTTQLRLKNEIWHCLSFPGISLGHPPTSYGIESVSSPNFHEKGVGWIGFNILISVYLTIHDVAGLEATEYKMSEVLGVRYVSRSVTSKSIHFPA